MRTKSTAAKRILLLTGPPGVGKTTVIRRIASKLDPTRVRGFITEEIRVGGERLGFRLKTFDGQSIVLAHVDIRSPRRVGKYGVDIGAFDQLVDSVLSLENAAAVYLIDEIGRMECLSRRFVSAATVVLESTAHVIATIAARGDGFIQRIKAREDAELWHVARADRDALPLRAIEWLEQR